MYVFQLVYISAHVQTSTHEKYTFFMLLMTAGTLKCPDFPEIFRVLSSLWIVDPTEYAKLGNKSMF